MYIYSTTRTLLVATVTAALASQGEAIRRHGAFSAILQNRGKNSNGIRGLQQSNPCALCHQILCMVQNVCWSREPARHMVQKVYIPNATLAIGFRCLL